MPTSPLAARLAALALVGALAGPAALAQQKVGYVDSAQILERMPEFRSVEAEVDRLAGRWQAEVDEVARAADALQADFAARELLFTDEERERKLAEITAKRQEHDALRLRYFGPEGELFREQQSRLRPVQERVLEAVEAVAEAGDYDFVFDRSGDFVFLYTRARHDLTDLVLEELGLATTPATGGTTP